MLLINSYLSSEVFLISCYIFNPFLYLLSRIFSACSLYPFLNAQYILFFSHLRFFATFLMGYVLGIFSNFKWQPLRCIHHVGSHASVDCCVRCTDLILNVTECCWSWSMAKAFRFPKLVAVQFCFVVLLLLRSTVFIKKYSSLYW